MKKNEKNKKRVEVPNNWVDMSEEEQDKFIDDFLRSVFPPPSKD